MKTNLALTVLLLSLLTVALTQTAFAQTAVVGVNAGNSFSYNYKITWESTDPAATVPAAYTKLNDTQFVRLDIINVDGTQINVDSIRHFNDGTETKQNGNIDVNLQVLEVPYSSMIIRANANPDEKVYPLGGRATLNEIATKTYAIVQVETIHYVFADSQSSSSEKTDIFYDRAHGVGLEYSVETQETSGSYVTTTIETLTMVSWVIPEFPSTALLLVLLLAVPVALLAAKKELLNRKFSATSKNTSSRF
jgi:hypothetical protein